MDDGRAPTHYDLLGVAPQARAEVIRAAYLALAKLHHPDGPTPDEEQMKRVNQAWDVLRSPEARAAYDAELARTAATAATAAADAAAASSTPGATGAGTAGSGTAAPGAAGDPAGGGPAEGRWGERPGGDGAGGNGTGAWAGGAGPARHADDVAGRGWGEPTPGGRAGADEVRFGRDGWGETGDHRGNGAWSGAPGPSPARGRPPAGDGSGWSERPGPDAGEPWPGYGPSDGWGEVVVDDPWEPRPDPSRWDNIRPGPFTGAGLIGPEPGTAAAGFAEPGAAGAGHGPGPGAGWPGADGGRAGGTSFGGPGWIGWWGTEPPPAAGQTGPTGPTGWPAATSEPDPTAVLGRRSAAHLIDLGFVLLPDLALVRYAGLTLRPAVVIGLVLFLAVHVLLEGRTGGTPGKALCRVRTVRQSGRAPGCGRALVRSVLWVVDSFPWVVPLVGVWTARRTLGHRRVGDLAARTFVVRAEDAGWPLVPAPVRPPTGGV